MRGTGCSGGAFEFFEDLQNTDGYDIVEAVHQQEWSAKVGMIGLSYPAIATLFTAQTQPPNLSGIFPNSVISDTAEYGCYIYSQACEPLLKDFMAKVDTDVIGKKYSGSDLGVDNRQLNAVNEAIRSHPVEIIGKELRGYMTDMEKIATKN